MCSKFDIAATCPIETTITALALDCSSILQTTGVGAIEKVGSSHCQSDCQVPQLPLPTGLQNSDMAPGSAELLQEVLNARSPDLKQVFIKSAVSQNQSHLADFDWSLRVS
jgi:hypothetical protein